ncbi:ABC-type multidrug transport system, ATPase component [Pyrodictium delaneyi]|uniref:ABC-type multidrug transport system, ATPase component n=1 Tax=Pyrodictium delaneyi TaxID=1273541 RepID=A0A0P0N5H6_9CREN|nr:ABC transporter ATP-binding protein [Pyrodictium delaneyi]ALL01862.1 ABC-type multidrug transport system, ATPase component [Pyrodictium delaneyi]
MEGITVQGLTKRYGEVVALDSVSFSIGRGSILGTIGPNGAGKTTLIRILSCLLRPDSGYATIHGHRIPPCRDSVKRLFALLPQEARAHFYTLTPLEYIYHYLRMRGYPREEARARAREAVEEFGIHYHDRMVLTLSGGMVRKMLLAMVLSADVPVYYLDEPTVGLDVENRLKLWDILRRRAKAGSTILVTSHYLNEISSICDKVLLIKDGRVAAFGEPEELGRRYLSGFYSKIVVLGEYSSSEHMVRR